MNIDDVLKIFIAESQELLQQMEDALLQIEQNPQDPDLINAIFRAAHTIKGSAGLFGLDTIVSFTHVAESVLDRIRSGELAFDDVLAALFLKVCDHLNGLVSHIAAGLSLDDLDTAAQEQGMSLVASLSQYFAFPLIAPSTADETDAVVAREPGEAPSEHWHLSLRFGPDVLRNGMDPLAFLRYLNTFGRIVHIVTLTEHVPAAADMDPETNYLGFELAFETTASKETIEGAFEFVREDSLIRILPPDSKTVDYIQLINELPEEDLRLGEMLVRCGTLTQAELDDALRKQAEPESPSEPIGQILINEQAVQPPVINAALQKQKQVKESRSAEGNLIRVDANKLDQLINLIGELIIAGAGTQLIAQQSGMAELVESTGVLSRLVEEVRDSALTLRMVQIGTTFNRFQRVVRDVSKEIGKDIVLEITGGETELDKTVVEKIGDPLTHLVRNSMDHGIEPAAVRLERGKPVQGTVRLNAYHESSSIVIEVSDDGGGLNRDRILRKAIERGLVNDGQNLTDKEIFNLIFEPGFSTADQVSSLSGRGVGMDVVKKNITALRGSVELDSVEGVGTTTRIRLPLTLAIIDGFLIGVGKASYVVPLDMVEECIELTSDQSSAARQSRSDYLDLRGDALPFVRLRELFAIDDEPPRRENVVVVNYAGNRAGLVVDQLMGEFQTVIKPLGKIFDNNRALGGFTILGSGSVALILSVPGMISAIAQRQPALSSAAIPTLS
ncbi:two-component system chemotaxis sensor kinase CheA [Pseudomonas duriflava]|uniref:Chemotaxis protein CheA n=1 Tax=Pseudomonas duriflava TaxID=459528 RepID=A0A562QDN0_9PSED|nr:chemotaxis protein CheA [Pseudomonas duriflava]TWI54851.1 two-component system chemotaxis sensor kinase CheA [Pseudomonas duriflava]